MISCLERMLAPLANKLGNQRHLQAISNGANRSEEHTSELPSRCSTSYAAFCLKKNKTKTTKTTKTKTD